MSAGKIHSENYLHFLCIADYFFGFFLKYCFYFKNSGWSNCISASSYRGDAEHGSLESSRHDDSNGGGFASLESMGVEIFDETSTKIIILSSGAIKNK